VLFGAVWYMVNIYAYVFSVLAGIIPLSLRNEGHLIPFAPLSASGGATAPSAPGSAAYGYGRFYCHFDILIFITCSSI